MLRLLLLRHAKAEPFAGSGDRQRALTERGRADAARLGAFLASENVAPLAAALLDDDVTTRNTVSSGFFW